MIYVVNADEKILFRVDAWYIDSEVKANAWIRENGYTPIREEITFMGDKVIWVEEEPWMPDDEENMEVE